MNISEESNKQYQKEFGIRLSKLRVRKGVSARDMSLSIGQNAGYINSIENGRALPSMKTFFVICDYLGISPCEFFYFKSPFPDRLRSLLEYGNSLDEKQLEHFSAVIKDSAGKNNSTLL